MKNLTGKIFFSRELLEGFSELSRVLFVSRAHFQYFERVQRKKHWARYMTKFQMSLWWLGGGLLCVFLWGWHIVPRGK